jgi:hypothetical protein
MSEGYNAFPVAGDCYLVSLQLAILFAPDTVGGNRPAFEDSSWGRGALGA